MRVEPVPVIGPGDRIPGPVGGLEVLEDDAGVPVPIGRVAPHVEVPPGRSGAGPPGPLEPGMLVRRVIQHKLRHDPEAVALRLAHEHPEVAKGTVGGMDPLELRGVVPVVAER